MTSKPVKEDIEAAKKELEAAKKEIEDAKKDLEKVMLKYIFEYVKTGIIPKISPNTYMDAHTIVHNVSNLGKKVSEVLFDYHNETIQKFIEDCYKTVSKETTTQLIDSYIKQTDNINFII